MLFEAIERPFRGDDNYDKPYDLSLEQTAMIIKVFSEDLFFKEENNFVRNHLGENIYEPTKSLKG
jgi:hypothetical protein